MRRVIWAGLALLVAMVVFPVPEVKADPTNGTIWVWTVTEENPDRAAWYDFFTPCFTTEPGANSGKVRCSSSGAPTGGSGSPYQHAPVSILD